MAERLPEIELEDIQELKENVKKKNTKKAHTPLAWTLSRFSARAQVPWPSPEKTVGTSRKASGSSG